MVVGVEQMGVIALHRAAQPGPARPEHAVEHDLVPVKRYTTVADLYDWS